MRKARDQGKVERVGVLGNPPKCLLAAVNKLKASHLLYEPASRWKLQAPLSPSLSSLSLVLSLMNRSTMPAHDGKAYFNCPLGLLLFFCCSLITTTTATISMMEMFTNHSPRESPVLLRARCLKLSDINVTDIEPVSTVRVLKVLLGSIYRFYILHSTYKPQLLIGYLLPSIPEFNLQLLQVHHFDFDSGI